MTLKSLDSFFLFRNHIWSIFCHFWLMKLNSIGFHMKEKFASPSTRIDCSGHRIRQDPAEKYQKSLQDGSSISAGNHRKKFENFPSGILLPQNYRTQPEPGVSGPGCSTWVWLPIIVRYWMIPGNCRVAPGADISVHLSIHHISWCWTLRNQFRTQTQFHPIPGTRSWLYSRSLIQIYWVSLMWGIGRNSWNCFQFGNWSGFLGIS